MPRIAVFDSAASRDSAGGVVDMSLATSPKKSKAFRLHNPKRDVRLSGLEFVVTGGGTIDVNWNLEFFNDLFVNAPAPSKRTRFPWTGLALTYNTYPAGRFYVMLNETYTVYWDGASWTQSQSGRAGTGGAIWGTAVNDVVVAVNNTAYQVHRYNGSVWSVVAAPMELTAQWRVQDVSHIGSQYLFLARDASNADAQFWLWNKASTWTDDSGIIAAPPFQIARVSDAEIWACGGYNSDPSRRPFWRRLSAGNWSLFTGGVTGPANHLDAKGIYATSGSEIYAVDDQLNVGHNPAVYKFDGALWSYVDDDVPDLDVLNSNTGNRVFSADGKCWITQSSGRVDAGTYYFNTYYYNGSLWSTVRNNVGTTHSVSIFAIHGIDDDNVMCVGWKTRISDAQETPAAFLWNGTGWTDISASLESGYVNYKGQDVWAVPHSAAIVNDITYPFPSELVAVHKGSGTITYQGPTRKMMAMDGRSNADVRYVPLQQHSMWQRLSIWASTIPSGCRLQVFAIVSGYDSQVELETGTLPYGG